MTAAASLSREVRRLALPAIANSFLQTLVLVVDRAMLGHHAETSLAAMQIAGAVEWSLWSIFSAFEVGTIARIGAHVGARRRTLARRAATASLGMALASGTFVALASRAFLALLPLVYPDTSAAVMDAACGYLGWALGASPVVFAASTMFAILQASGDTKTPLFVGALSNAAHVAINLVLIPRLGPRGAGISTTITFAAETAALGIILSRRMPLSFGEAHARLVREARAVVRIAAPAGVERILYHLGFLTFVGIITRLGDVVMAANQALLSLESICYLSADGFGIAAATLVAQKRGAGAYEAAGRAAKTSTLYAVTTLTTLGLLFYASHGATLRIFSNDASVLAASAAALPILALAQPFMATGTVLAQSLRGAGFTRPVLGVSVVGALFVRLACTWFFAVTCHLALIGVWLGSTADWAVRSALLVFFARSRLGVRGR